MGETPWGTVVSLPLTENAMDRLLDLLGTDGIPRWEAKAALATVAHEFGGEGLDGHETNACITALADIYRISRRTEQQNAADFAYYKLIDAQKRLSRG